MKLLLLNETYTYNNDKESLEKMFSDIMDKINGSNYHFSHLVIDGEEIYENYGEYILERLNDVKTVEVVTKTVKELIMDTLLSTESYLKRAIPEVQILADEFYQNPTHQTWEKLQQLIEGVQWIAQMILTIDQLEEKLSNWDDYLTNLATLQNELPNLLEAMENQDALLIGDIIQYEFLPIFESLQKIVTETIDNEGERPDLS